MKKFRNAPILLLLSIFLLLSQPTTFAKDKKDKIRSINSILSMEISSSINPATLNYLKSGLQHAVKEESDLVLIKLNTPGGLLTTTKDIMTLIGSSDIPTLIWITPEGASATSAGAIIASSAHILLMSNGTNIGAATPIQISSGEIKQTDLRKKAINDLVALVQSMSEARNRNGKLFGEMVEKASSFKAKEAFEKKLIDGIANTKSDLFKIINNRQIILKGQPYKLLCQKETTKITDFEMDLGQWLLNIFANPAFAYLLFIIGAALIYLELQAPGGFIAGSLGTVCLILAGIAFQVLPLNLGALGLIVLSFVLFILEIYITSYGILTLAGLASLTIGSLFLFRTDNAYLAVSGKLIFATVASISLFIIFIASYWIRDSFKKKAPAFFSLIGKKGVIMEKIPRETNEEKFLYRVKISGEIWKAESNHDFVEGDTCHITEHDHESMIIKIDHQPITKPNK